MHEKFLWSWMLVRFEELHERRRGPRRIEVAARMESRHHPSMRCGRIERAGRPARLARLCRAIDLAIGLQGLLLKSNRQDGVSFPANDYDGSRLSQMLGRRQPSRADPESR